MDFDAIFQALPLFGQAALLTVRISVFGIALSLLVGTVCAAIQNFRIPILRHIVGVYIELSRNTPLLVQLVFLYYGLPKLGLVWSGEACAVIGLAFLGGSYMAEALRSGLEAVPHIQFHSAVALGLTRFQAFRYVVVPQGVATSMPALSANVVFLVKETSVVSIIAVPDLVYRAKEMIGIAYNTTEALTLLVAFYLVIVLPISLGARWLEGKARNYAVAE